MRILAITIPFTNEVKHYPVRTRYHKRTASGWGRVETFAHNRKETHLQKLEKLEMKIDNQIAQAQADTSVPVTKKTGKKDKVVGRVPVAAS